MPPPAPMKPQTKPTIAPQITDRIAFCLAVAAVRRFFGSTTGLTMNFTPSSSVIKTEKLPIVVFGTTLATKLPTKVRQSTAIIMMRPFLMSRFLFFP